MRLRFLLLAMPLLLAATPLPQRTERFVYDTANVIDDTQERVLEQRHQELFAKTGVAIAVLTVPTLVDETIDQLAVRAGQTWGVGRKDDDRGLVIALSRDDRKIFVATGYGTEGYLPDGRVGALIDEHAVPSLRQNRFSEGIVQLTTELAAVSAAEYGVTLTGVPPPRPVARSEPGIGRIVFFILSIIAFMVLARRHPVLAIMMMMGGHRPHSGGFGGGFGGGGFGGGGFGGGGAGRGF